MPPVKPPAKRKSTTESHGKAKRKSPNGAEAGIDYDEDYSEPCCWTMPSALLLRKFRLFGEMNIRLLSPDNRRDVTQRLRLHAASVAPGTFDAPRQITTSAATPPPGHCLVKAASVDCFYYATLSSLCARRTAANVVALRGKLHSFCSENPSLQKLLDLTMDEEGLSNAFRTCGVAATPLVALTLARLIQHDVYLYAETAARWLLFPVTNDSGPADLDASAAIYLALYDGHVRAMLRWDDQFTAVPEAPPTRSDTNGDLRADTSDWEDEAADEEVAQAQSRSETYPNIVEAMNNGANNPIHPNMFDEPQQVAFERYVGAASLINVRPLLDFRDACNDLSAAATDRSIDPCVMLAQVAGHLADSLCSVAALALRVNQIVRTSDLRAAKQSNHVRSLLGELDNLAPLPKVSVVPSIKSLIVRVPGQSPIDLVERHKHVKSLDKTLYAGRVSKVTRHLLKGMIKRQERCFYTWSDADRHVRYIQLPEALREQFTIFVLDCFGVDPLRKADEPKLRLIKSKMMKTLTSIFNESRRPPIPDINAQLRNFRQVVRQRDAEYNRTQLDTEERSPARASPRSSSRSPEHTSPI